MCSKNMSLVWSEAVGWLFFFLLENVWLTCLHFTALWLCLSAGAAEVIFYFAVLRLISSGWPQDALTVLWPHSPPPHTSLPYHKHCTPLRLPMPADLAAALCWSSISWAAPSTESFISCICYCFVVKGQKYKVLPLKKEKILIEAPFIFLLFVSWCYKETSRTLCCALFWHSSVLHINA